MSSCSSFVGSRVLNLYSQSTFGYSFTPGSGNAPIAYAVSDSACFQLFGLHRGVKTTLFNIICKNQEDGTGLSYSEWMGSYFHKLVPHQCFLQKLPEPPATQAFASLGRIVSDLWACDYTNFNLHFMISFWHFPFTPISLCLSGIALWFLLQPGWQSPCFREVIYCPEN